MTEPPIWIFARTRPKSGAPDPSIRPGDLSASGRKLLFSQRCALNAIESLSRALAGVPPDERMRGMKWDPDPNSTELT